MSVLRSRPPWPSPLTPRRRRALAGEIEEELRAHVALRAAENEREGMSPEDALADAQARFGDLEEIHAACLDAEDDHPLRLAGRVALRVGMLAVGFGAVALAFALAQSALLQPLRFAEADRLVRFGEGWDDARVQASTFLDWHDQSTVFDELTALDAREYTLTGSGLPAQLRAMRVGERYFEVFGVAPMLGRAFTPDEVEDTPQPVVLLSEALWESRFRRAPSVLGRSIMLDGEPHAIVGVIPAQGQLSHVVDIWTPLPLTSADPAMPVYAVGRLREGVDLGAARADLASIALAIPDPAAARAQFNPLHDLYATPVRPTILLLLVVSALILVLVWATLFRRTFDLSPLGRASGTSTAAQGWGEAFMLAGAAALLGGGLAFGIHRLTYDALFDRLGPLFAPPGPAVVVALLALAIATAIGLVAAQQMASWRETARPWRRWLDQTLVVGSTAALVVVLALVVQQHRTVWAEPAPEPGLDDRGLYVADLSLSGLFLADGATARMRAVLERVREVPGVEAASLGWAAPFHSEHRLLTHTVDLLSEAPARAWQAAVDLVGEGYFETVGASLALGRNARVSADTSAREAVVSASFAAQAWPGESALGQRIDIGSDGVVRTVVGVVEDLQYGTRGAGTPVVYIPTAEFELAQAALVVRAVAPGDPALSAAVRRAVFEADPEMAVEPLHAVAGLRAETARATRTRLGLLSGLAGLGLVCVLLGSLQLIANQDRVTGTTPTHRRGLLSGLVAVGLGLGIGCALAVVAPRELAWLGDPDRTTVLAVAVSLGLVLTATRWVVERRVA